RQQRCRHSPYTTLFRSIKEKAIAEPHEETVKRIKELHDIITSPEKVIPRFQCEIFGAKVEDLIQDHLIEMKKHSYSQFPAYNHRSEEHTSELQSRENLV